MEPHLKVKGLSCVLAGFFVSIFSRRFEHDVAAIRRIRTLFHSVITLFLVCYLSAESRHYLTAIFRPPTGHMLIWILFWRRHVFLVIFWIIAIQIIALLFVGVLPSSGHSNHATVSLEFALDELVGISVAAFDIFILKIITFFFMNVLSPSGNSDHASVYPEFAFDEVVIIMKWEMVKTILDTFKGFELVLVYAVLLVYSLAPFG